MLPIFTKSFLQMKEDNYVFYSILIMFVLSSELSNMAELGPGESTSDPGM